MPRGNFMIPDFGFRISNFSLARSRGHDYRAGGRKSEIRNSKFEISSWVAAQ
jgi:hypothetical protein